MAATPAPQLAAPAERPTVDVGDGPEPFAIRLPAERKTRADSSDVSFNIRGPDGKPVGGAHVFVFQRKELLSRTITGRDGRASLTINAAGPVEFRAILPRVGQAVLQRNPKWPSEVEGQLTADPTASLPRPLACEDGKLAPFSEAFLPGGCLTMSPEVALSQPVAGLSFDPGAKNYSSPAAQIRRPGSTIEWNWSADRRFVRRVYLEEAVQQAAPERLRLAVGLLTAALGAPVVALEQLAGRPHGDAHCGTPVPGSTTTKWTFPPLDGLEAIEVSARVDHAESAEETIGKAHSLFINFERKQVQ